MPYGEVTRREWGAIESKSQTDLWTPLSKILFIYQTFKDTCHNKGDCSRIVQRLQKIDIHERKLADINLNFLIGGDGHVYEGRGFDRKCTLRTDYVNNALIIGFIGDFSMEEPPDLMWDTADTFIQRFIKLGKINAIWRKYYIRENLHPVYKVTPEPVKKKNQTSEN